MPASQAGRRGFESHRPLFINLDHAEDRDLLAFVAHREMIDADGYRSISTSRQAIARSPTKIKRHSCRYLDHRTPGIAAESCFQFALT